MSNKETVLNALRAGKTLTASQITNSYRAGNAHEVIRQLRADGHAVYSNTGSNGKITYRLGTPSRRMIAAAYAAAGSSVFTR